MLRTSFFVIPLGMLLLLGGCASSRVVSNDRRYQSGFAPGQVYRLVKPAVLLELSSDAMQRFLEAPEEVPHYSGFRIRSTLPAGTKICILQLTHEIITAPVQGESHVEVYCELADAPNTRMRIGWGLCRSANIQAPDGWPTVVPSPNLQYLQLDMATTRQASAEYRRGVAVAEAEIRDGRLCIYSQSFSDGGAERES